MRSNLFIHSLCVYSIFILPPSEYMCAFVNVARVNGKNRWAAAVAATTQHRITNSTPLIRENVEKCTLAQNTQTHMHTNTNTDTPLKSKSFAFLWRVIATSTPAQQFSFPQTHPLSSLLFFVHRRHFFVYSVCVYTFASLIRIISFVSHFLHMIQNRWLVHAFSFFDCFFSRMRRIFVRFVRDTTYQSFTI